MNVVNTATITIQTTIIAEKGLAIVRRDLDGGFYVSVAGAELGFVTVSRTSNATAAFTRKVCNRQDLCDLRDAIEAILAAPSQETTR